LVGRPALSHDGQTLAFGLGQKEVVLLNAKTGEEVRRLEGSRQGIDRCFFSPDDQAVLGWGNDKRLHVWEARSGKKHRDFEVGRASDHRPSAFSPDGRLLALRGEPNRLFLCETTDGKLACQLEEMAQSYSPIAFSPDGRTMAVAEFSDRKIALFELATGKVRCIFSGHRSVIRDLAFSPEGKTLASCSQDTTGIVWDVASSLGTRLSPEEVEKRWTELGSDDAARAFQAMKTLIATPELVVPLLAKELRPAAESDSDRLGRIAGWISDLDHDDFARREAASRELAKEIEDAEPLLRKALDTRPSAEVRTRAQALLKGWEEKKELKRVRAARALEVLEHINNAESRRLLAVMAKGTPDARLTREAKASLERLAAQAER